MCVAQTRARVVVGVVLPPGVIRLWVVRPVVWAGVRAGVVVMRL